MSGTRNEAGKVGWESVQETNTSGVSHSWFRFQPTVGRAHHPICSQFPFWGDGVHKGGHLNTPRDTITFSSSRTNQPPNSRLLLFDRKTQNFHRTWCSLSGYHMAPNKPIFLEKDTGEASAKATGHL